MKQVLFCILLLCLAWPASTQQLSPDEAYQEALHRIEATRVNSNELILGGESALYLYGLGLEELPLKLVNLLI